MNPDYERRQRQLVEIIKKQGLDHLLLFSNRSDSRYAVWARGCACKSSGNYLLIDSSGVRFIEVSYRAHELRQATGMEVLEVVEENLFADFFRKRLRSGGKTGIAGVAPATHFLGCDSQLCDLSEKIDSLMGSKSEQEIEQLSALARSAAEIVDMCWNKIAGHPNSTEDALGREIRSALMSMADHLAFPLSVVSGENLRIWTLGSPTERSLGPEDACVIDFGVTRNGLTIDLTRTYFRSENELSRAYDSLTKVLFESVTLLRPGLPVGDWIIALQSLLRDAGLPEGTLEVQDLGHGVGFGLHEPPFIGQKDWDTVTFEASMVLCIEPEIVVSGIRLRREEMVTIHATGARIIS